MRFQLLARSYRERYVNRLNNSGCIISRGVERALRCVDLHRLVDEFYLSVGPSRYNRITLSDLETLRQALEALYSGKPIVLSVGLNSPFQKTLSAETLTLILESCELETGIRVLEIGGRTGYIAALLSEIVEDQRLVTSIHTNRVTTASGRQLLPLAGYADVLFTASDGFYGNRDHTPFDRIILTVGCPDISPHWISQLSTSGFMVIPVVHGQWFPLLRVWRESGRILGRVVGSAGASIDGIGGSFMYDRADRLTREVVHDTQERPPWPELQPDRLRDFWFYLSVTRGANLMYVTNGERVIEQGVGVDSVDGWGIVTSGSRRLFGHNAALDELEMAFFDWTQLGEPRMADYQLEFVPKGLGEWHSSSPGWKIERQIYSQNTWLEGT